MVQISTEKNKNIRFAVKEALDIMQALLESRGWLLPSITVKVSAVFSNFQTKEEQRKLKLETSIINFLYQ